MRGKRNARVKGSKLHGITPADAGKTCLCWALRRNYWDHPRGCGENPTFVPAVVEVIGSPPRMRGKLWMSIAALIVYGITPADAGKTGRGCAEFRRSGDHPRGCGENLFVFKAFKIRMGSPPRMRGKLRYNLAKVIQIRITPADAGKTQQRLRAGRLVEDHPRGCGENRVTSPMQRGEKGSPPRMRGKPICY